MQMVRVLAAVKRRKSVAKFKKPEPGIMLPLSRFRPILREQQMADDERLVQFPLAINDSLGYQPVGSSFQLR